MKKQKNTEIENESNNFAPSSQHCTEAIAAAARQATDNRLFQFSPQGKLLGGGGRGRGKLEVLGRESFLGGGRGGRELAVATT